MRVGNPDTEIGFPDGQDTVFSEWLGDKNSSREDQARHQFFA